MKVIAFYLPQFHEIPENNKMWGEGFTEWVNVKKAKPLFEGHFQPVEPLDDNYYDLTNNKTLKWQVELAKKYGIYGFCFYHYWYNEHMLLHKPVEIFLNDKSLNLPFCLSWANHDWTMAWVNKSDNVLYSQDYSIKEEWDKHFDYLYQFFVDERYIRKNGKPLMVIYQGPRQEQRGCFVEMLNRWDYLAKEKGLGGLCFAYQSVDIDIFCDDYFNFDYDIEYQPAYVHRLSLKKQQSRIVEGLRWINSKTIKLKYSSISRFFHRNKVELTDYDYCWNKLLQMGPIRDNSIPGAFVGCDTTPRRRERGFVIQGMTPEKFKGYFTEQIIRARDIYKSDMLFIFAWNEWAEGAYLEPDKRWGYAVLEAIKESLIKTNEFPQIPN